MTLAYPPFVSGSDTSLSAALAITKRAPSLRQRVLDYHAGASCIVPAKSLIAAGLAKQNQIERRSFGLLGSSSFQGIAFYESSHSTDVLQPLSSHVGARHVRSRSRLRQPEAFAI